MNKLPISSHEWACSIISAATEVIKGVTFSGMITIVAATLGSTSVVVIVMVVIILCL